MTQIQHVMPQLDTDSHQRQNQFLIAAKSCVQWYALLGELAIDTRICKLVS